jgi:hypothetical protein
MAVLKGASLALRSTDFSGERDQGQGTRKSRRSLTDGGSDIVINRLDSAVEGHRQLSASKGLMRRKIENKRYKGMLQLSGLSQ